MTDRLVVLMVVMFLGIIALTGLIGTIYLIVHGIDDSTLLLAVSSPSSAALGALTAVLVSTHSSRPEPTPPPTPVVTPVDPGNV